MSEQASLSKDVVGGLLASPLSFARTCWRVLSRPVRYFDPIALGDKKALQRAFSFFAVAAACGIAAHFSLLKMSGMSIEMPTELTGGSLFNQVMQNDWLYKAVISLIAATLCGLWYWTLRRKAVRDRITAVKFIHAVLPPAGALLMVNAILGAAMIAFIALAPVSHDLKLIAEPSARELIGIFCKKPDSYMCRGMLVQQQFPLANLAFIAVSTFTVLWFAFIVAQILKAKTGITQRRTISAFVLSFVGFCLVTGMVLGIIIGLQAS